MGTVKQESKQMQYEMRQMEVSEEKLDRALGTDNDFYEIIPGYVQKYKEERKKRENTKT